MNDSQNESDQASNINDQDSVIHTDSSREATDSVSDEKGSILDRLSSSEFWMRLVFMLIFGFILIVAFYVLVAVVVVQFFWMLISGEKNDKVLNFGRSLSQFMYQAFLYLTYNSDEKPFPFKDWPEND